MTASDLRLELGRLMAERLDAAEAGLGSNALYMRDLDDDLAYGPEFRPVLHPMWVAAHRAAVEVTTSVLDPPDPRAELGPTTAAAFDAVVRAAGGDPAAVAFDAVEAGRARGRDVVIIDTAGRLHTQANLMGELAKVRDAGAAVRAHGMRFNAGHALNYFNVQPVAALTGVRELHIGHSIVSRAVFVGLREAVREMKSLMREAAS